MHNLGVGKKIKVDRNGQMYTHSDFRTSADSEARAAAISLKRSSVLNRGSLIAGPEAARSLEFEARSADKF